MPQKGKKDKRVSLQIFKFVQLWQNKENNVTEKSVMSWGKGLGLISQRDSYEGHQSEGTPLPYAITKSPYSTWIYNIL